MLKIKQFYTILFFLTFLSPPSVISQEVYVDVSNESIYSFLDEMANQGYIEINSVVQPYSRKLIAIKLSELNKDERLNKRQKEELHFFLKDYNKELNVLNPYKKRKDLFFYKDSVFTISINPILGVNYFTNSTGNSYHRWNGIEAWSYLGENLGIYANLRDNHESKPLSHYSYITKRRGGVYKSANVSELDFGDYSEMKGGISYGNKYGTISLIKDHFIWGNNYNGSNIFSGRTPSFAHIKLDLHPVKWMCFNYIHGWLVSGVIDSINGYQYSFGKRNVMRDKFLAANILTITPYKKLNISIGNSVIYSDMRPHPAYLIPFFFYKSVDHSLNGASNFTGQNSQMFFDVSSRNISKLHLYSSIFIDEISIARIGNKNKHSNFYSFKGGIRSSNFFIENVAMTYEYTRTNPITYLHFIPSTTFESNKYNLGHYLGENAQENHFSICYKPLRGLSIVINYSSVVLGDRNIYTGIGNNGWGLNYLEDKIWRRQVFSEEIQYQLLNDVCVFVKLAQPRIIDNSNGLINTSIIENNKNTISLGLNWGY